MDFDQSSDDDYDHEDGDAIDQFPQIDPSASQQAESERQPQESYNDDPIFREQILRERLKRRTDLINELRKSYLRDVLAIKGFLQERLAFDERKELYEKWKDSIPSIDLRQHLMLYSPHETSLNILHCETCGGSIEIVHHESSEIEALSKALSHNDKTKHDLKVVIGTKAAQLESLEQKWEVEARKHREEKKVLFREIRDTKQKIEELNAELEENRSTLSKFRVENNELLRASGDALETRDLLRQCRLELDRSLVEMRHVEEEMAALQIHRGLEADKLIAMTKNRDSLESQLATALAERDAEIQENLRMQGNYEAIQKREVRLQNLLDITRKELETLQMTNSELKAELAGIHSTHSSEVESLEKLCDSLREEHDAMSQSLEAAQSHLTKAIQSQEETEAENSRLQQIFETFRSDKGREIDTLKAKLASHTTMMDESAGKLKEYEEKFKKLQSQIIQSNDQLEEKEVETKHLRKVEGELKRANQDLEKQIEKLKTRINMLERQLSQKREEEKKRAAVSEVDNSTEQAVERKQRKSLQEVAAKTESEISPPSGLHVDTEVKMEPTDTEIKMEPVETEIKMESIEQSHSPRLDSAPKKVVPKPSPTNTKSGTAALPSNTRTSPSPSPSPPPSITSDSPNLSDQGSIPSTPSTKYTPMPRQRGKSIKNAAPQVKSQKSTGGEKATSPAPPTAEKSEAKLSNPEPPVESKQIDNTPDEIFQDPPLDESVASELPEEPAPQISIQKESVPVSPPLSPKKDEKFTPKHVKTIKFSSPATPPVPTPTPLPVLRRAESDLEREDREEREMEDAIIVSTSYGLQNLAQSKRLQAFSGLKEGEVINLDNPNELISRTTAILIEKEKHDQHQQRESWIKKYLEYFQENVKKNRRYSLQRKSIQHLSPLEIPVPQPAPVPESPVIEEKIVEESNKEIKKSDSQGSDLDWTEESDAIEKEMGVEVAKVWGLLMSGINDTLSTRLPEDEIGKLLKCLSPVTIEFAASLAKATMGMWRGMMIAKGTADLLCNVRRLIALARPHYGFSSTASQIENVKSEFKSATLFTSESHLWRNAYSLDPTVLRAIEKEEREMTSLQHITERRIGGDICFFGDDPKIRPFQYDIALSSLIQMKDYVDSMQMPTQISLRQLCNDWATTKITSLDADRGDQINQLRNAIRRLESDCSEKEKKLKGIEGEVKRVNEFKERIVDLKKREKELMEKAESSYQENQKLAEEFHAIQTCYQEAKSELQVTTQQIQLHERKLQDLKAYTASYERDKAILEAYQEKEKIKQDQSVDSMIQTDYLGCDVSIQTDFFAPPMTLKHQVRPPSQSGYTSLTRSSSSSLAGFSTSIASSRPSTSYPIVTPQVDTSSLYSASISDFAMGHGGYDYPQPTSPYHDGSSTVPSTIFIGQQQDMDGEGDVSLVSSAWSSLEFDDMSDIDPLHVSSVSRGFDRGFPSQESTRSHSKREKRKGQHAPSASTPSTPIPILSPVRVPSARRTRPRSPGPSSIKSHLSSSSSSQYHNRVERGSVDAMSSQSIPSSQSVEDILQAYRQQGRATNHNRKWLQTR